MDSLSAGEARDLANANDSILSGIYKKIKEVAQYGAYKLSIVVPNDRSSVISNVLENKGYDVELNWEPFCRDAELIIRW